MLLECTSRVENHCPERSKWGSGENVEPWSPPPLDGNLGSILPVVLGT